MRRARRSGGFTLLEILIAIGILAIGLVTVFALFPVGIVAVRDTVEGTRGASLARTSRSELASMRADLRVMDAGSQKYAGGYVPFGPWRYPGSVDVFREFVSDYVLAGVPVEEVVFDDRLATPVFLIGLFDGTATVRFSPAEQMRLTRDSDRLEHYYNAAAAGANKYDPWTVYASVRGRRYQVMDRAYLASGDLQSLTFDVAPPAIVDAGGSPVPTRFSALLPVTRREPPIDVDQEWEGAIADFPAGGPTYNVTLPLSQSRNIAEYLCDAAAGAGTGGWISILGDWYQVASVPGRTPAGMPQSMTLTTPMAAELVARWASVLDSPFEVVLPVVRFDTATVNGDVENLPVLSEGPRVGGGGPQLSFLETGAYIEIVLDGGYGDFNPFDAVNNPTTLAVTSVVDVNPATSWAIRPGNFIRVGGKDYEIAGALGGGRFDLARTVPSLGPRKYFKIVLGCLPGQVPAVARFPVRNVTRSPQLVALPNTYAYPVTSFDVGRDQNGNLPADPADPTHDLGMAAGPAANPVHVLPRNFSQFSYEAVLSVKSPTGIFRPDIVYPGLPVGSPYGPNDVPGPWKPNALFDTPRIGPIEFPPALDPGVSNFSIYTVRTLSEPTSGGVFPNSPDGWALQGVNNDRRSITLAGAPPTFSGLRPFHAYDTNEFDADLIAGSGGTVTVATKTVNLSAVGAALTADETFLAPAVPIYVEGPAGRFSDTTVESYDRATRLLVMSLTGTLMDGDTVTVLVKGRGAAAERPRGWGQFVRGSQYVISNFPDDAPTPAVTVQGFPFVTAAPQRYHLAVGDYVLAPDGEYYAVKAIVAEPAGAGNFDQLLLDRAYSGLTDLDYVFTYVTPAPEVYEAQVAVFRNYEIQGLRDLNGSRKLAAAFGFGRDSAGAVITGPLYVYLALPLPGNYKPGDYIRADGDADHPLGAPTDVGMGDAVDGDTRWYMIDSIPNADRRTLRLNSPYRGYIPAAETYQPASATGSIVRTYDTVIGAL